MDDNNLNMSAADEQTPNQPGTENGKGFAIAALVLGICAVVIGCCIAWIGIICGVLAIVFSILYKTKNEKMSGMAIAGLVLGIIGLALGVIGLILGSILTDYLSQYADL